MDATEPTTRERTAGQDGDQKADDMVLMSNKPLHRFVQREPRNFGIVIVIFGCAELLMGIHLAREQTATSCNIYIPFWQGALFFISGNLSIYTEIRPSKKMVTVCFAMYLVSIFGCVVSTGYRLSVLTFLHDISSHLYIPWSQQRALQLFCVEVLLFLSALCVAALLIFLSTLARLALKSTHSQVVVQWTPAQGKPDRPTN